MNLGFIKQRVSALTRGAQGPSSSLTVYWSEFNGAVEDPVTGALVSGTEQVLSGTMRGVVHQTGAQTRLRAMTEIQAGDLIVELDPSAEEVVLGLGQAQSGTVALDSLRDKGPRFEVDEQLFVQAELGDQLAAAWHVMIGGSQVVRTILLRKAT